MVDLSIKNFKNSLLILFVLSFNTFSFSQLNEVKGKVIDENKEELPFVVVLVSGTSKTVSTDFEGNYSIEASAKDTLIFSFVGYSKIIEPVNGRKIVDIQFSSDDNELKEIVVTALGIEKDEKALGYDLDKVDNSEVTETKQVNFANSLKGKVAGLNITQTSGGPESSVRINLRGIRSLTKSNQPLIVVDGVPIDNTNTGSGGTWGGVDYGSPISDINPDDIESISVLKGANAAALYGARAADGVILITTKKGRARKGIGINYSSTSTFDVAAIQKEFQNEYGEGTGGDFYERYALPNGDSIGAFNTTPYIGRSWGPKLQGQQYLDWDSTVTTYSPQPDNYKDFFRVGRTLTNSFSVDGGNETSNIRISFSNMQNRGIVESAGMERNSISVRASTKVSDRLKADFKTSYVNQQVENRQNQSDGRGAARNFILMPRNVSIESLRDYKDEDGNEKSWYKAWAWAPNPYWIANEDLNKDSRDRVNGVLSLKYDINDWLYVMVRSGIDFYNERRYVQQSSGSISSVTGSVFEYWQSFKERNTDFLISAKRNFGTDFKTTLNFGGNRMKQTSESLSNRVGQLPFPNFYNLNNYTNSTLTLDYWTQGKAINSIYAFGNVTYKDYLFFDLTGRTDWSSTLSQENASYTYPSANVSFAFTDAFDISSNVFRFGKLRLSAAQVASDDSPFLTNVYYEPSGSYGSIPVYSIQQNLGNSKLKPERTNSLEIGTDLLFFTDNVGLDITHYRTKTNDVIVSNLPVAPSSGFSSAVENAATLSTRGIDLALTLNPIDKDNLKWNNTITYSRSRTYVDEIFGETENIPIGGASQWNVGVYAVEGELFGDILGYGIDRDAAGNALVNADGTFKRTDDLVVLGNITPDFKMSLRSQVQYKNFTFGFLLDFRKGGDMYSASNTYLHGYSGNVVQTLDGRDEWYTSEANRRQSGKRLGDDGSGNYVEEWKATGGKKVTGVYKEGTIINGQDVSGQSVDRYIDPEIYWSQFADWGNEIHEPFVYEVNFLKLREISVGYVLPKEKIEKIKLNSLAVNVFINNPWLIYSSVPNVDPEAAYNNGNGAGGIEYATYPIITNYGVGVNVSF